MRSVFFLGLLATPAFAQTHVIPHALTNAPGSSSTNFPLGNSTPSIAQYVYDNVEVGLSAATTLRSLEVRALATATNAAKANVDLEISLGATSVPAASVSTAFASNRGTGHTVVYARRLTNLPATTPSFPGQYCGPFPFDAPFVYDPAAGTGLLVEYNVASQPAGAWPMDTPFTAAGPHASIGVGCGGFTATSTGGAIGTNMTFTATGGVPNNPAVLLFGDAVLPAPFPLPTPVLGCNLYQNILATVNVVLGATTTPVAIPVPASSFLRGFVAYGQFGTVDASFNLVATNARRVVVSGPYAVARITNNTSNTALTGSTQQQVGIVTRFGL